MTRELSLEPLGCRSMTLLVTVRRYRCTDCGNVWRQDTTQAAGPRAKLSRRGLRWALEAIVHPHLTVARVAEGLGVDGGGEAVHGLGCHRPEVGGQVPPGGPGW